LTQRVVACVIVSQALACCSPIENDSLAAALLGTDQLSLLVTGTLSRRDERVRRALTRQFALVEWAEEPATAERLLPRCHFDCIVVEAQSPEDPVLGWIGALRDGATPGQIILVAGAGDAQLDAAARRAGAHGCLPLPLDTAALKQALNGKLRADAAPVRPRAQRGAAPAPVEIVGASASIRAVRTLVDRIAPTSATVLVEGETGTGKELVARLLHQQSGRPGPFVPVNCGAIAPELMESELFGHAKGAFTGAHQVREGLFLAADGGTLFLDEIASMRPDLQVKLLRTLEEGAIRPVGTDREVAVEARIVASVQPGLAGRVADGRFREDLYYRLNVAHIVLPPLRKRPDDIAGLAAHFMSQAAAQFGMPAVMLADAELEWLRSRPWPGNVRELRNVIERAVLLGGIPGMKPEADVAEPARGAHEDRGYPLEWTLEQVKEAHMRRVVQAHAGNKSAAARQLGVSRKTLERKLGTADADDPA
jgi:DNA-binding NtrC family response regulator